MADYQGHRSKSTATVRTTAEPTDIPGKRTLVEGAYLGPSGLVQQQASTASDTARVHSAAAQGVATPSSSLPHGETIQRLFGRHDISAVQAHTGREAGASAAAMGATAYATGNHVVLGGATDLHTVAHEAAHVVQQRGGVQLKGGVGEVGDAYERHADAVADAVVQGKSAEGLLDQMAGGGGGGGGAVQRAVGFEFEFGAWRSSHVADRSRLTKGETIEHGDGFQVQGEDVAGKDAESAVEFVTEPAATRDDVTRIVGGAATKAQAYLSGGDPVTAGAVSIKHGGATDAQMQVSPAVPLPAIPKLYGAAKQQTGAKFVASRVDARVSNSEFRDKHLEGNAPSPDLHGLLVLVVDYLRQGTSNASLNYPKEAIAMMARTSFTKMFSLLPEAERLTEQREQWIAMVLDVLESCNYPIIAPLDGAPNKPALGQTFKDLDPVEAPTGGAATRDEQLAASQPATPGGRSGHHKLNVTREEWLRNMPERDLLSNATDHRFEGMGKLGTATDAEAAGAELAAVALGADHAVATSSKAVAEDGASAQPPLEAPLFELRGGTEMFGVPKTAKPGEWLAAANQIFETVDTANGGRVFRPEAQPLDRASAPKQSNPHLWDAVPQAQPAPQPQRTRAQKIARIIMTLCCHKPAT